MKIVHKFVVLVSLTAVVSAHAQGITGTERTAAIAALGGPQATGAETVGMNVQIALDLNNVSLYEALKTIASQAALPITFGEPVYKSPKRVTLKSARISAKAAIQEVLLGTGLKYSIAPSGQVILTVSAAKKVRGEGIIVGKITDSKTGQAVIGANVFLDANPPGVITGDDGSYRLTGVSPGKHTVSVRLVGYAKQTREIVVNEQGAATADFKLEPSTNVLDQVVVTGTVIATELKAVPSAITIVTAKQIEERGITKIEQLFHGDIPGLFAPNRGALSPLDSVSMFSRGATVLTGSSLAAYSEPIKTYVDGVELAMPGYLNQIDPKSIERIEILTGPQASTIYGSNAINGVMQIFTKRGSTKAPKAVITLLSGTVENNYSSAFTPQHDYSAQLSGMQGQMSYNSGATWSYMGPWSPAKQTSVLGGYGGLSMPVGPLTTDVTMRRSLTRNRSRGSAAQGNTVRSETGRALPTLASGTMAPTTSTLQGQTFGLTVKYSPFPWWSHQIQMGDDNSESESLVTGLGRATPSDSLRSIGQSKSTRSSLQYVTTVQAPVGGSVATNLTVGLDRWSSLLVTQSLTTSTLIGTSLPSQETRLTGHNTGAFVQGQIGLLEKLFLTYGLRAEWNPDYGRDETPSFAPRYGAAYTQEVGPLMVKLRGSYGRSTRPPKNNQRISKLLSEQPSLSDYIPFYGNVNTQVANLHLGPEFQQGGEGGLELYMGGRASLVVTRYNQTVDNLITTIIVDSARSLQPFPKDGYYSSMDVNGYGYFRQVQFMNVGSIRNQGWELSGSVNTGPFTTRGTYSWTKSRVVGITQAYRSRIASVITSQFQPGRSFDLLPEHTWALNFGYANRQTTMGLNLNGVGPLFRVADEFSRDVSFLRLAVNKPRASLPIGYRSTGSRHVLADLNTAYHFSEKIEGLFQVQNLTDHYQNDAASYYAAIGRQAKAGVRIRLN